MKNNLLKLSNWENYTIRIKPSIFSRDLLEKNLDLFWKKIVENISKDQHILFLFRLQWSDTQFVTIGNLQRLNKEDKDYILDFIMEEIKDRGEYYLEQSIISIVFSYGIREGRALEKVIQTQVQYHNYQHHKLPITMDPLQYGRLIKNIDNTYFIQINDKNTAVITQFKDHNEVEFYRSGILYYKFIDKWLDELSFTRIIGKKEFIFNINGEQLLLKLQKPVKFISKLNRIEKLVNKFITMDIETFIKDGVHIPYCISWYDGENTFSYYLTDYINSNEMIFQAISDLMIKKYDNYKVYIHNLANFDAIFLLKLLAEIGICHPIIHHDKIISIGFNMNGYVVQFRYSQQLLIGSLAKLGVSFGVKTLKSYFPYNFAAEDTLNYIGPTPSISLFKGISDEEYEGVMSYTWNFKAETIRYYEIDCISLFQVVLKFNELIFGLFNINIHKYPTLSSLAFAIFRSNFLTEDTIPQLSGQVAKDLRLSFTGGACDMYIPHADNNLFAYDVNSLYPSMMKNFDMPIGKPTFFEGDIRLIDQNAFGFFFCNIIAPENLDHPILQTHVKTNDGVRTIAPLGQWSDMNFSQEMDNAIKFGYKFEILWGYTFEKGKIFNKFVESLYNLRLQYPKTDPLNYIAKLLSNAAYGKFGMIDSFPDISIISIQEYQELEKDINIDIIDTINLGEKILVKHRSIQKDINPMLDGYKETHNVSQLLQLLQLMLEFIWVNSKIIQNSTYIILILIVFILIKNYLKI